jgi:dihydroneopterin aldolase
MDLGAPDQIELRGLRVVAVVGVLAEERDRAQPLEVDLALAVDTGAAGLSDALADTVDYGAVCDAVVEVTRTERPLLLERLAARVAEVVLGLDERITAVEVAVRKLRPPVPHDLAGSGVRIVRRRGSRGTEGPT